ncbi:porin [Ascidiimonas sp. W6]|uniref:porin n=1 Tax=Ascidiimonas meishanensis TaxID=3128903 RepID=UPI0030EBD1E4
MKTITITNIVKKVFFLTLFLSSLQIFAQEEEKKSKFTFSGSVDGYFRTNFNGLNKVETDEFGDIVALPQAPASSFANDPGFALGMVNLIAGYEGEKVGFVADLVFGPRGEDAVFASVAPNNIVNQLYVYWNVSEKVKLTFGNFNTYLGYEVISPAANFNYSTSYMFSYGPFSHTGLKADFVLSDKWSAMLAIMNPTDLTEFNPSSKYTLGAQIGYAGEKGSTYLNFLYGEQAPDSEATFQVDLTTGADISDTFYLGFNATYNDTDGVGFYGAALYPQLKTSESFAIGLRAEYFKELEDGGPVYGGDVSTVDFTLTGSYTVGDLTLKPELRLDSVSEEVFLDSDLDPTDNLASFVLATIYTF